VSGEQPDRLSPRACLIVIVLSALTAWGLVGGAIYLLTWATVP
jgi:hypothetical protein